MGKLPTEMTLLERKTDLIVRLYVSPADEDYLTARWCYGHGAFHTFYWCAGQAFEKYLKAILLFQDLSTQSYGHDLVRLFNDVQALDKQEIVPRSVNLPETTAMGRDAWQGKPSLLYADYLKQYGSSDNRYAFRGTFVNGPVLQILDLLCVSFRHLIRKMNFMPGDIFEILSAGVYPFERIEDDEPWMIGPELMLERLYARRFSVGESEDLRRVFSNMNLSFFRQREENERTFGGQHFYGSPLYNHLVRLREIDSSGENSQIIDNLREWASCNI